jgi:hypothetical protein
MSIPAALHRSVAMRSTARIGMRIIVSGLTALAACSPEPSAEEPREARPPAVDEARDSTAQTPPAITIRPVSNIDPDRFPHSAHETVECATCHTSIPGHTAHQAIGCAQCHAAAPGERARPSAAQCDACHHGPAQTLPCSACHGGAPASTFQRPVLVRFSVKQTDTRLILPFEHGRHAGQSCSMCHVAEADIAAVPECSACHESHHDETRRCLTCHTSSPLALHDRQAHVGCGGSGCHTDAAVTSLAHTRQVCLVCHATQEDHEPGSECALCHIVQDGDRSSSRPFLPASGADR